MNYTAITTLEAVHTKLGLDMKATLPDVSMMPEAEGKNTINSILYERMIKAINMDGDGTIWEPDYTDGKIKINPWHDIEASKEQPGGFAFSSSYYDDWGSYSFVGSRRCFRDSSRYWHALEHFKQLFLETMLILK